MNCRIKNNISLKQQRGFSLIELMVAIPLGLLIMFAVLQIFTVNIQGVNLQNAFSRVQENGRMSTELLTRDIRAADYWGCIGDTGLIINTQSLTSAAVPTGQQGLSGADNLSSATISTITAVDGTDSFTLRGSTSFSDAKIAAVMGSTAADISFTTGSGITTGDLLVIADCNDADVFTNTSTTDGTISHSAVLSSAYGFDAQILVPYVKTYFIGVNPAGSNSLYRSIDGTASELVRGVNDLQVMYGEDTNSNGSADTYSLASAVTNMDNVVSLRVWLTSESGSGASGTDMERVYVVTTSIRNRSLD